jgi:hypothetical protein
MKITYLPVLRTLRELYVQPRSMQRFRQYIDTLTGGTEDIVVPIGVANPMAKEHALTKLDELLALDADEIGASAAEEAQRRLARVDLPVEIKASIVLADDIGGGWTNRYTTESMVRFPSRGALKRPFATALVWTSDQELSAAHLRREVLAAIYRVAYQQRHGLPTTLRHMLDQEGLAGVFCGATPTLDNTTLERGRTIVEALDADTAPYPVIFAAMYGDAAAEQLGYQPLGLPPRAGFSVAVAQALAAGRDPVTAL